MRSSASEDFGRDNGLIHEVVVTGRKAGWGKDEWSKLAHNQDIMRQIRDVLRGVSLITPFRYSIDCDADPAVPQFSSLVVHEHRKMGTVEWDEDNIKLYYHHAQRTSEGVQGWKVREIFKSIHGVLNANVLDFLLLNPYLIPSGWNEPVLLRGKEAILRIFFWGTIYRNVATDSDHSYAVRYLVWRNSRWASDILYIGTKGSPMNNFCVDSPGVIFR